MPDSGYINIITINHRTGFYRFQNSKTPELLFFANLGRPSSSLALRLLALSGERAGHPGGSKTKIGRSQLGREEKSKLEKICFENPQSTINSSRSWHQQALFRQQKHSVVKNPSPVIPALLEAIVGDAQDSQQANSRENDDRCVSTWLQWMPWMPSPWVNTRQRFKKNLGRSGM